MKHKIAVDIHGVIDQFPKFFKDLMATLVQAGWEVHILTGKRWDIVNPELIKLGVIPDVHWTHIFSISEHHLKIGTKMWGTKENPWMDDEIWSKTKAEYCQEHGIELCLDDTDRYLPHFTTPVARYYPNGKHTATPTPKDEPKMFTGILRAEDIVIELGNGKQLDNSGQ